MRNEPVHVMACVVKRETPPIWRWKLCELKHGKGISESGINNISFFLSFFIYIFFIFIFWCGIHTASLPSAAETHTGGGAVLGKPEGSPARRHSRKILLK